MARSRKARRRPAQAPALSDLQRIEQAEGGERALQDWLDRSHLAYLFLDQTPLTMPASFRSDIKRPDFLVAIEALGTVAIDAKAKAFIADCFILDASERRRLDAFEATFGIPVWYACFPPDERECCHLFRNRDLMGAAVAHDVDRQIIRAPLKLGFAIKHLATPFARALLQAGAYRFAA